MRHKLVRDLGWALQSCRLLQEADAEATDAWSALCSDTNGQLNLLDADPKPLELFMADDSQHATR